MKFNEAEEDNKMRFLTTRPVVIQFTFKKIPLLKLTKYITKQLLNIFKQYSSNHKQTKFNSFHFIAVNNLQILLLLIPTVFLSSCFKETVFVQFQTESSSFYINNKKCALNEDDKSFYYAISNQQRDTFNTLFSFPPDWKEITFNGRIIHNNEKKTQYNIELNTPYHLKVELVSGSIENYTIEFTNIPIFEIFTTEEIIDEEKIFTRTIINFPESSLSKPQVLNPGIEIRGGISTGFSKKSYALEFCLDSLYGDSYKINLGELRNDDDWILDAMYIDQARMRNRVSFDLWRDICNQSEYNAYSGSKNGIDGCYALLFINNKFNGFYSLNEKIDKKQLQIREHYNLWGGYLYKAWNWGNMSVTFENDLNNTVDFYLDGWELKYPKSQMDDTTQWTPLVRLLDFAVNSTDAEFKKNIHTYINIRNFADYFIFLNTIQGVDNWGKNTFLYKYDENYPFHIAPWDLDGTWGRSWNGNNFKWNVIFTNNLYNRLMETNANNFNEMIKNLWGEYRKEIITSDNMMSYFKYYKNIIDENGLIYKENILWEQGLDIDREIEYIESWLSSRLDFLDEFFSDTSSWNKVTYYGY